MTIVTDGGSVSRWFELDIRDIGEYRIACFYVVATAQDVYS